MLWGRLTFRLFLPRNRWQRLFAPNAAIVPELETIWITPQVAGFRQKLRLWRNWVPRVGEPVYDRLDAEIAYAMMGINAVKGVEIGAGFASVAQRGSEHGDE